MIRRYGLSGLASAVLLVSVISLSRSDTPPVTDTEDLAKPSPAAAGLLNQLNTVPEQTLKTELGLAEPIVAKIMAFRTGGGKFTSVSQLQSVTGMPRREIERILAPFMAAEEERKFEAQRKPVPEPSTTAKAGGKSKQGAPAAATGKENKDNQEPASGEVTATGTGPITAVRPGFYGKLPGYEALDKIDPLKRTEFLETVNREFCTCGCKNETVAFCLVNDPSCPVVKSRAKKIYDDIMNKPAH